MDGTDEGVESGPKTDGQPDDAGCTAEEASSQAASGAADGYLEAGVTTEADIGEKLLRVLEKAQAPDTANSRITEETKAASCTTQEEQFDGAMVELHGLKTVARNGLVGRAGPRKQGSERYPVKLGNGETLLVKPENLRLAVANSAADDENAPRTCKCPCCGVRIMASCEEDCIAHMSQCSGFARVEKLAKEKGDVQLWPPPRLHAANGTK